MSKGKGTPKMKLSVVTNKETKISFMVRIVERGDNYGHMMQLTHDKDMPMIEFYDTRYKFDRLVDIILGQFVSRYYLGSFKDINPAGGLCLQGGVSDWYLDSDATKQTFALLEMWGI